MNNRIILASASPRRSELLKQIGFDFQVVVSNVEEKLTTDEPHLAVEELSAQKAMACYELLAEEHAADTAPFLVIGADTVVACDGKILGKPADAEDAKRMLRLLQGKEHQVYTGVTLVYHNDEEKADSAEKEPCKPRPAVKTFYEVTTVEFYPMTEKEIASYVATGEPFDKAGAYGIQGLCAKYIKGIRGDYNNVVGLPAARVYQEVKNWLKQ